MKYLLKPEGITVFDLKCKLSQIPDINENGEPFTVWLQNPNGTSSPVTELWPLNQTENGSDILITSEVADGS